MNDCYFCNCIKNNEDHFFDIGSELFIGMWDLNPVTPGHALVMPKRHVQFMQDLTQEETERLVSVVVAVKRMIKGANLNGVYQKFLNADINDKSKAFITEAINSLAKVDDRPPDNFNDGLNDGPAAGQTVPHFHWHIMPRWIGDVPEPRGGIRHMFAGMGNYEQGIRK